MKALKLTLSVIAAALFISCGNPKSDIVKASEDVIVRTIGTLDGITLQDIPSEEGKDCYEISAKDGELLVKGSSPSAICYAFT